MKRDEFIKYCLAAATVAFFPGKLFAGENNDLPNVLLLGDSISIGYTTFVKELLTAKANVFRPMQEDGKPENCSDSQNGVKNITRWVAGKKWAVIHFNFGLHDIKHVDATGTPTKNPVDPLKTDPTLYEKDIESIVHQLKSTGAGLIFATTTPVPNTNVVPLREPENVIRYNQIAQEVMKKEKIEVNDLYSLVFPKLSEIQRPDNVHYTEAGYRLMAGQVAKKIESLL